MDSNSDDMLLRTVRTHCPPYRRLFAENFHSIEIVVQILVRYCPEDRFGLLREGFDSLAALSERINLVLHRLAGVAIRAVRVHRIKDDPLKSNADQTLNDRERSGVVKPLAQVYRHLQG